MNNRVIAAELVKLAKSIEGADEWPEDFALQEDIKTSIFEELEPVESIDHDFMETKEYEAALESWLRSQNKMVEVGGTWYLKDEVDRIVRREENAS